MIVKDVIDARDVSLDLEKKLIAMFKRWVGFILLYARKVSLLIHNLYRRDDNNTIEEKRKEGANIKSIAEGAHELKSIEGEFVKTLRELRWEIEKLEREKASLFEEIEDLKEKAEERAQKLRDEVETLRKEVAELKELFGAPES